MRGFVLNRRPVTDKPVHERRFAHIGPANEYDGIKMLIHVVPRAQVAHTPVLTYRTSDPVVVGQLVTVPLRGRSIPGIVVKNNVSADTAAPIQTVRAIGSTVVPTSYLATLNAVADYYGVVPAAVWSQFGAAVNGPYLSSDLTLKNDRQECIVTPAHTSSLSHAVRSSSEMVPLDARARREQWQRAAAGRRLQVVGGTAAITLPFRSLQSIVLDAPLASPYRSNRSPGFNTATLTALVAQSTNTTLTIRTPLSPSIVQSILPVPKNTSYVCPKLHPITAVPLGTRSYVNSELVETVLEHVHAQERVLIYLNRLPKPSGRSWSVDQIALDLEKRLGRPVAIAQKGIAPTPAAVTVATSHALYDHDLQWDFAVVLSLEGLLSPNQPRSPLAAVETLAALASRTPVYTQYRDSEHPLVQIAQAQLDPESQVKLPVFTKRLLTARFPTTLSPAQLQFRDNLIALWPDPLTGTNPAALTFVIDPVLNSKQRDLLHRRPKGVRLLTDDDSLPSTLKLDAPTTER